jgi:hypothetical protein
MVLEFVLSGLCALVRDECTLQKAGKLNVILMKGHVNHTPRLVIETQYTLAPDHPTAVIDTPDGKQYLVWDLTGHRLDIPAAPAIGIWEGRREAKSATEWKSAVPNYNSKATVDPPDDFSWIPELAKACNVDPAATPIHPDARKADVLPSFANARLMTLNIADSATNQTDWIEAIIDDDPSKPPRIFEFQPNYKQVLGERVKFTMTLPMATQTRLELYSYKDNRVTETITVLAGPGGRVPLQITNLPAEHVAYSGGQALAHFTSYFELLATNPGTCKAPTEQPLISVQPVKCTVCSVCGQ